MLLTKENEARIRELVAAGVFDDEAAFNEELAEWLAPSSDEVIAALDAADASYRKGNFKRFSNVREAQQALYPDQ